MMHQVIITFIICIIFHFLGESLSPDNSRISRLTKNASPETSGKTAVAFHDSPVSSPIKKCDSGPMTSSSPNTNPSVPAADRSFVLSPVKNAETDDVGKRLVSEVSIADELDISNLTISISDGDKSSSPAGMFSLHKIKGTTRNRQLTNSYRLFVADVTMISCDGVDESSCSKREFSVQGK